MSATPGEEGDVPSGVFCGSDIRATLARLRDTRRPDQFVLRGQTVIWDGPGGGVRGVVDTDTPFISKAGPLIWIRIGETPYPAPLGELRVIADAPRPVPEREPALPKAIWDGPGGGYTVEIVDDVPIMTADGPRLLVRAGGRELYAPVAELWTYGEPASSL